MSKLKSIILIISFISVILSMLFSVKFLSDMITVHYEDKKTVCLDAGHGGEDCGAVLNSERYEKDDNLKLTILISEKLEEKGIDTVLTRDTDSTVDLKSRCIIANDKHCELFVSIHRNSSITDGSGFEAWISKDQKSNEKNLATNILNDLCKVSGLPNRGVLQGYRTDEANNYYINANTNMPSMLLEMSFVTNLTDNKLYDEKLEKYADIISNDICNWFEQSR